MNADEILQGLYDNTLVGNKPEVVGLTEQGIAEGLHPEKMLFEALIPALEEVGARFEREVEPGEVLVIDRDGPRSVHPFSPAPPCRAL